jgi:hypothetical protein
VAFGHQSFLMSQLAGQESDYFKKNFKSELVKGILHYKLINSNIFSHVPMCTFIVTYTILTAREALF